MLRAPNLPNDDERVAALHDGGRHALRRRRPWAPLVSAYMGSGYTFSQCHVLLELSSHNSLNLMELADILLMDKSNTSRTVKKLVELELVSAKKVTSGNRQKLFSLTAKGEQALLAITQLADQLNSITARPATLAPREME